ncbi:unnamed protein product [Adineta steineri]|uniref:Uncharacterized protein n=1 Tax=Adineta steineri TaxID=433720 RepID=A0A819TWR6_9BILA|nr:unnamed protein product [Adineta steineri]CAF4086016.1 unnamed protein product [Adineta steineri]
MDNIINDLEAGVSSNIPRNSNKKMRKRKQLNNLLKFRLTKTNSNDILRSSEDELFLPQQKLSITKSRTSRYRFCWKYFQYISCLTLLCLFLFVCVGLISSNIKLKNEIQHLSSRITEIEKKSSDLDLNNILSTIEQIKIRLNFLEHLNFSLINDNNVISSKSRLIERRLITSPKQTNKLYVKNQQLENRINKTFVEVYDQLNSLRNDVRNFNQTNKIQQLITYVDELTQFFHNSSDKTTVVLNEFQSDLDKLRGKIDECKCSKELIHLKSTVVNSDQLQQNIVTKDNLISSSSSSTKSISTNSKALDHADKQAENESNGE